ncbi:MAG: leucine-rich repeat domain-containing protein [Clostridia bacterium]|nr:leucine-rich repeat domain-containing protein [Clostridia bacterium]
MKTKMIDSNVRRSFLWLGVFLVCFFAVLLICAPHADAAYVVDSGNCGADGDNVKWSLDSDGVLTISGKGAMADYESEDIIPRFNYVTNNTKREMKGKSRAKANRSEKELPPWDTNAIKTIMINEGVTSIGEWAFYRCSLKKLVLPKSLEMIKIGAFYWCESLKYVSIPQNVKTIGECAFYLCEQLQTVIIPAKVSMIDGSAFGLCRSLTSIQVDSKNKKYATDDIGCLYNKEKNILMQYPIGRTETTYSISNIVTTIKEDAFSGSKYLKKVEIPNSVSVLERSSFFACKKITSITIPGSVTSIGEEAFMFCSKLKKVRILKGVTTIEREAFCACEKLESIDIPNSVTSIGEGAFSSTNLTSVTIPKSVTLIGKEVFGWCRNLDSIKVETGNSNYSSDSNGCLYNKRKTVLIQYPIGNSRTSFVIPNSVTVIGRGAFLLCQYLTSITVPNGVKTIEEQAFYGTERLPYLILPSSVEKIGEWAFAFNNCFESVTILNPNCKINKNNDFPILCGYKDSTADDFTDSFIDIENHSHTYSEEVFIKQATLTSNGMQYKLCTLCGLTKKVGTIAKISTVKLSKTTYTFTGKARKPVPVVKDANGKKLILNTDFRLKYSGDCIECGKYAVKVVFIGNYQGKKTLKFNIRLAAVSGITQTDDKGIKIMWKAVYGATRYDVVLYQKQPNGKYIQQWKGTRRKPFIENPDVPKGEVWLIKIWAVQEMENGSENYSSVVKYTATAK